MPLLCDEFDPDVNEIIRICLSVANYWNNYGGPERGFQLFVVREAAKRMSRRSDMIFASFFADPPGPFKRIAAFLLLALHEDVFYFATPNSTLSSAKMVNFTLQEDWEARIAYLLIDPILAQLWVGDGNGGRKAMSAWGGFPSVHSKEEFLLLLQWFNNTKDECFASTHAQDRLAMTDQELRLFGKTVLSVALILEAVYYQSTAGRVICRVCDKELIESQDLGHLFYEKTLDFNKKHTA